MTRRLVLTTVCALAIGTQWTSAQQPAQAPQPPTPAPRVVAPTRPAPSAATYPAAPTGSPVNVKVEFTITDQRGTDAPIKRVISVIASDRNLGRVRSSATVFGQNTNVPLDVDATPFLLGDGKIRLQFTLSYDWPAPPADSTDIHKAPPIGSVTRSILSDSVTLVLQDGKPMIAAQSADPVGDRTVTVEVKATVLK